MSGDKYAAALWLGGRFLYRPSASDSNVTAPDIILAGVAAEIEAEVSAMLRGGRSSGKVVELCCGAIAVRNSAPTAHKWIAATGLLRSPCAQRQYCRAFDFISSRRQTIERIARVLANARTMIAAQALWVADQTPARAA
jgi:hypothetical protein